MPALAIADTVRRNVPQAQILFVGGEKGMEGELVTKAGYTLRALAVEGLSRRLTPHNLRVLWQTGRAVSDAKRILREFAPDAVIGTGGYACYPTLRAAAAMQIPCAIHESNAYPGLAVRVLSGRMDRVWLNFSEAEKHLARGTVVHVVGNPLHGAAAEATTHRAQGRHVLSFGGSLGADAMNAAVLELMETERKVGNVSHLHATGKRCYEGVLAEFRARGLDRCPQLRLVPFIEDMPRRMAGADLVICRAGAMSISELAAASAAAVLIPSPNVTGDHQRKNAEALAIAGAAIMLEEKRLAELNGTVMALLCAPQRLERMRRAISAFAMPDANRLILADILQMVKK